MFNTHYNYLRLQMSSIDCWVEVPYVNVSHTRTHTRTHTLTHTLTHTHTLAYI